MLWFFFRWLFWRPRYRYEIVATQSFASADDAAAGAKIKANAAAGEVIGIAADALCCTGEKLGTVQTEWDVYLLIRY